MITDGEMRGYCDSCRYVEIPSCIWDGALDGVEGCAVVRRILFEGVGIETDLPRLRDRMAAMGLRLLKDEPPA